MTVSEEWGKVPTTFVILCSANASSCVLQKSAVLCGTD